MNTVTIQIGNSDDKLTQTEWSCFVRDVHSDVVDLATTVHFHGFSPGGAPWQNAAWVIAADAEKLRALEARLKRIREQFRQDAIAVTAGTTEFV